MDRPSTSGILWKHPSFVDSVHFALAGIATGIALAIEVGGLIVSVVWRLQAADLVVLGIATGAILFSFYRSIRLIARREEPGWLFLFGNCLYALLTGGLWVFVLSRHG